MLEGRAAQTGRDRDQESELGQNRGRVECMAARKAGRSQDGCITGAWWQCRVSWGKRISKRKAIGTAGKTAA